MSEGIKSAVPDSVCREAYEKLAAYVRAYEPFLLVEDGEIEASQAYSATRKFRLVKTFVVGDGNGKPFNVVCEFDMSVVRSYEI